MRGAVEAGFGTTIVILLLLCGCADAYADPNVNSSTLSGKLIMGYQGWFACPGDAAERGWVHWSSGGAPTVDMLPDVSELPKSERCSTPMVTATGSIVEVFSSQSLGTVEKHFAWMQEYGLDGVALQRFATQLLQPKAREVVDRVVTNVRRSAEDHGRVFFLMYDLSGMPVDHLIDVVADWRRLQAAGLTDSPAYLRHNGHPLVALWGLGFNGRPMTPQDAENMLSALHQGAIAMGGVTILGGVPGGWRTGTGDASPDDGWRSVWPKLDIISPWTVGRYVDEAGADRYRDRILSPDLHEARRLGVDLMPVVFPGFSWANLMLARHAPDKAIPNQIPRRCGRFYWRQIYNAVTAGASMVYGAMFDEVDEGTAMFKLVASSAQSPTRPSAVGVPAGPEFVTLDSDGCQLPSDWYLRLGGAATKAVRSGGAISPALPKL